MKGITGEKKMIKQIMSHFPQDCFGQSPENHIHVVSIYKNGYKI